VTADLKTPRIVRGMSIAQTPRTVNGVTGWVNYSNADGWEVILPSGEFVWVPREAPQGSERHRQVRHWNAPGYIDAECTTCYPQTAA
jgi:hypothetical protein